MKSPILIYGWKLLVLTLLCLATEAQAQIRRSASGPIRYQRFNTWMMVSSDARFSNRWGLHTEGQLRQIKGPDAPQQKFLRIGANYYVANILTLTAGYAYTMSFPGGNDSDAGSLPEHRSYQQILLRFDSSHVMSQHRYRLEQRWVRRPGEQQFTYLNRLRYQLRLTLSLGPEREITAGTPYLAGSNEVFIGFGRNTTGNFFEQNRACLALGYQVSRATSVEAGYMNQMARPDEIGALAATHILHLGLNFNPDFRKGKLTQNIGVIE
jgi:hypothetical protein